MKERKFVTVGEKKVDVELLVDYIISLNMVQSLEDGALKTWHRARIEHLHGHIIGGDENDESNSK